MAGFALAGDTSGQLVVNAPAAAGSNTLTLPAATGTVLADTTVGVCRAWVNFNGTGTVAIRTSFNVTSITDNNTGDYTVNFTTAISDANYAVTGSASNNASSGSMIMCPYFNVVPPTTTAMRFNTANSASNIDCPYIFVAVFR